MGWTVRVSQAWKRYIVEAIGAEHATRLLPYCIRIHWKVSKAGALDHERGVLTKSQDKKGHFFRPGSYTCIGAAKSSYSLIVCIKVPPFSNWTFMRKLVFPIFQYPLSKSTLASKKPQHCNAVEVINIYSNSQKLYLRDILLTAALLKLKVFQSIPLACLARVLLSMQGKLVNNNKHTCWNKTSLRQ